MSWCSSGRDQALLVSLRPSTWPRMGVDEPVVPARRSEARRVRCLTGCSPFLLRLSASPSAQRYGSISMVESWPSAESLSPQALLGMSDRDSMRSHRDGALEAL